MLDNQFGVFFLGKDISLVAGSCLSRAEVSQDAPLSW